MEVDESDKDISDIGEGDSNDEEECSTNDEGSEEESDDDDNGDVDETEAASVEENEDDDDAVSDDDGDTEVASTVSGDEFGIESDDEETVIKKDLLPVSTEDDPDASCPICLNEFMGQDLGSPENCGHMFCLECIVEWSKNINTCPIDRIEFHLIYMKQEISGDTIKKIKVETQKNEEEYVEEVTLCEVCRLADREDRLLLCDSCDSGYHCECLDPPLETIPIEEWFCPPCARVMNRAAAGSHLSHNRLIARTRASEIVRSRIQNHRSANSEDSGPDSALEQRNVPAPRQSSSNRRVTKRKVKRKTSRRRSTKKVRKARTKATSTTGKSKGKNRTGKTSTKRKRKTKRRKTCKTKKKSRRSWLASMKLVAPSVKKRIADRLGLCKPPPGHTMPYVKKSSGQHPGFVEQLPSLNVFGCRDQLFDFGESYTDDDYMSDMSNAGPSTSKLRNLLCNSRKPIVAVASTSGINLLDNILENQNVLLRNSKNITIGKDGSLSMKQMKNQSVKPKCEVKSEASVSEQGSPITSSSLLVKRGKSVTQLITSPGAEHRESATSAAVPVVNVKREKCSPSRDPSSVCTKDVKLHDALPSFHVKKEKECSAPRVRFSEVETIFTIPNAVPSNMHEYANEIGSLPLPLKNEDYLPHTSFSRPKKKDIPHLEKQVFIKREKNDDFPLEPLVDMRTLEFQDPSPAVFSFSTDDASTKKDSKIYADGVHRNGILHSRSQPHEDSLVSKLSSKGAQEGSHVNDVKHDPCTGTHELSFSCSSVESTSPVVKLSDHHSQNSSRCVGTKTKEHSMPLYSKSENDRKRHLPFLPGGMNRPFKIPKLAKRSDGNSAPKNSTVSSEVSTKHLDTKVLTKSQNITKDNVSLEPVRRNQCDLKFENVHEEHMIVEYKDSFSEAMDVDVDSAQKENVQLGTPTMNGIENSLSHASKQNMNEFHENLCKTDENCESLLPPVSNNNPVNNKNKSVNMSPHQHHKDSDKKPSHHSLAGATKSDGVENSKQKHGLVLNGHTDNNKNKSVNMNPHQHHKHSNKKPLHHSLAGSTKSDGVENSKQKHGLVPNGHTDNNKNKSVNMKPHQHHKDSNKKPSRHSLAGTTKSDGVENSKQKHGLVLNGMEKVQNHKTAVKSSSHESTEHRTLKPVEKVLSKQKLKEDIIAEIKKHLKDFYLTDLISKDEYKEIMRRSVPKVFQNCGNSIDSEKIRKLVVNYVHIIGNTKSDCS